MTFAPRTVAAAVGLAALIMAPICVSAEAAPPQIAVVGEGTVSVAPDMARITIGVTHQAATAAEALDAMNADLAAILDRLATSGIAPRHMQSSGLRLHQYYENYENARRPAGYEASSDLNVQVHDLPNLGAVLDAVVRDGANEMRGLSFDVADPAPHLAEARRKAVADAAAKAGLYAEAAGVAMGNVLLISEGGQGAAPRPMMMEASFDSARAGSVPVAEGEMSIKATINMVWSID